VGLNLCFLVFRILDSAQVVWEDSLNLKYYETMFKEIESIFEQLGFDDDVREIYIISIFDISLKA